MDGSNLSLLGCGLDWSLHWGSGGSLDGSSGDNFLWLLFLCRCGFSSGVSVCSLSFLDVLGEDLVVLSLELLWFLEAVDLCSLDKSLPSESLLGNESLDVGWLVESLVSLLDLSSNNVLSNVVLLSESENLADVAGSLGSESSLSSLVGNTFDFSVSLLDDLEWDDSKIGSADAASNWLSLSLAGSSWSVGSGLYLKIVIRFSIN